MNNSGPIILIEDDKDDQELFSVIFKELKYSNEVIFFEDGETTLEFLIKTEIAISYAF